MEVDEGNKTYTSVSGIVNTLNGDLSSHQRGQLLRDRGSDDGSHVTHLRGSSGENESQWLALLVIFHAVLRAASSASCSYR